MLEEKIFTKEELEQMLHEERSNREQQCWSDIQKCLRHYKCSIEVETNISNRGIFPFIKVIAQ